MLALLHKGEAVIPERLATQARQGTASDVGHSFTFVYQPMYSSATPAEADAFGKAVAQVLRREMGTA
jgi:hypothetical protein